MFKKNYKKWPKVWNNMLSQMLKITGKNILHQFKKKHFKALKLSAIFFPNVYFKSLYQEKAYLH
jgi:hypothetical protein